MYKRLFKRILDLLISLFLLIILSPVLLMIIILLFLTNKGHEVFFLQDRPGKNEKIFRIIKFKTMTDAKNQDGKLMPDAQRLTRIGRFIRVFSIDELPQLFNVIKGDMSLIGPRPLLVKYLPYYSESERIRHTVRPGITGWAQVNGRSNIKWDDKLSMDIEYVEKLSFKFDLVIMCLTLRNVILKEDTVLQDESLDLDEVRKLDVSL